MKRSESLSGPLLVFVAEALVLPAGLVGVLVLGRHLGPTDYGLYSLAAAIVLWPEWVLNSLVSGISLQMMATEPDSDTVANALFQASLALGAVVALALGVGAWCWAAEPLRSAVWVGALLLPLAGAVQPHRSRMIVRENFRGRALGVAMRMLARALGPLVVVWCGWGALPAVAVYPVGAAVELAVCRWFERPRWWGGRGRVKIPWGMSSEFLLYAASQRLSERVDVLSLRLLGYGLDEVGIYAAAQSVALLPGLLGGALAAPVQSRVKQAGSPLAARRQAWRAWAVGLSTLPAAGIALVAARPVVEFAYGPGFARTAELVAPLLLAGSLQGLQMLASGALHGLGYVRWTSRMALAQVVLTAVAMAIVVPVYGGRGAAWAWCGSAALGALAAALLLLRSRYTERI